MKWAPMRFGGVSMRHNPEKLSISGKNRMQEYLSPCCEADCQVLGRELCRVSGEGVLFGTDCIEQYHTLEMLQRNHTPAKLVLPKMQPLYAYLKSQQGFQGCGKGPKALAMSAMLKKIHKDYKENPDIKWNFTKFVVDRAGNVVARFEPTAAMKDVATCISSLL